MAILLHHSLSKPIFYHFHIKKQIPEVPIRKLIKDNAPQADELFSYGMPTYKMNKKPLVYFAAYKNHIGFYATPQGHHEFKAELSKYKQGRGSVQFPLDQAIPYDLIERIIQYKVAENNKEITKKTNC